MSQPIILYDIAMAGETPADKAWSPNSLKTRLALNFKGLAHKTQWLSFVDTAPTLSGLGLAPHVTKDPRKWTVPTIFDPKTQQAIMGSQEIAAYLEDQYPDQPALFPPRTRALQAAFYDGVSESLIVPIFTSLLYKHLEKCASGDKEYFRTSREAIFGCAFDDILPKGEVAEAKLVEIETVLGKAAGWIDAGAGVFIGGDEPLNADFNLVAMLLWAKMVGGKDHAVTRTILRANGGRWARYISAFDSWATL
ncbi:hypothetical protein PENSPDRAFT_548908, partial [Peniophora sp. CONT]